MTKDPNPQKKKMLAVAGSLFWRKGYDGTTMKDIANAYKCKPANIYNFFPSKEALLYAILRSQMERIISSIKHLENNDETPPVQQLRVFIENHANLTLSYYAKPSKLLFDVGLDSLSPANRKKIVKLRDTYDRILCKIIQRGIESGDFAQRDVKLAAYSIASMIVRSLIWFSPGGRLSAPKIIDFMTQFALNGLSGKKV
jgi:AcrR family transcriptional regulator